MLSDSKAEVRAGLGSLAIDIINSLWVYHCRLVLLLETAGSGVAGLLRAHSHAVEFSLFRCHVAIITIEGTHGSLSTAMQSCRLVCDGFTSLLGRCKFLNEAVCRASARFRRSPLVSRGHRLHDKVFVVIVTSYFHFDRLELFL